MEYRSLQELVEPSRGVCYGIVQPGPSVAEGVPIIKVNNLVAENLTIKSLDKTSPEIESKYQRSRLRGGEILLSLVGSLGHVARATPEMKGWNVARAVGILPIPEENDPEWVAWCLRSPEVQHQMVSLANTSVQATLNLKELNTITIPFPSKQIRSDALSVLSSIQGKIELNRRQNETLKSLARALFQSWFVDFDPVRAKASGETEAAICQRLGVSPQVLALFPAALEDSALGEVPAGWEEKSIADLTEANAWTLGKKDALPELDYIEISEVSNGNIGAMTTYERGTEPGRARRRLRHGDTVLSMVRPDRGAYFLAINPSERMIASTGFAVISPTVAPWSFIHTALTMPNFFEHLGKRADGAAYPVVHPVTIGAWPVAYPDNSDLVDAFDAVAAPLFLRAEFNRQESRTLAAFRDELLPRLLSGELSTAAVTEEV